MLPVDTIAIVRLRDLAKYGTLKVNQPWDPTDCWFLEIKRKGHTDEELKWWGERMCKTNPWRVVLEGELPGKVIPEGVWILQGIMVISDDEVKITLVRPRLDSRWIIAG